MSFLESWSLVFICVAMIAAAVIDGWKFKVPNWLTFPVILSGWLFGLLYTCGLTGIPGVKGGIGDALVGTALGFALLFPMYLIGGMGAGDVKMQMGFGSWVGVIFGSNSISTSNPGAIWVILIAFCTGVIAGGIIGIVMILMRRHYRENLSNVRAIVMDLLTLASISKIAAKANERRPRWHRLPYGIPLCIGFLGTLFYYYCLA